MDNRPEADAGGPTQGGPGPSRAARRRRIRTPRKPMPRPTGAGPTPSVDTGMRRWERPRGASVPPPMSGRRLLRGQALGGRGVRPGYRIAHLGRLLGGLLLCCRFSTSGLHRARGGRRTGGVGRAAPGRPRRRSRRSRCGVPRGRVPPPVQGSERGAVHGIAQIVRRPLVTAAACDAPICGPTSGPALRCPGRAQRTIEPGARSPLSLAFSPDGHTLATVSTGNVAVETWDTRWRHHRAAVRRPPAAVSCRARAMDSSTCGEACAVCDCSSRV